MKVLVACERSGRVRDAFIKKGHNALSCDIMPSDAPGPHYAGRLETIPHNGWDLVIAFPPCTHLCSSGARWFKDKVPEQNFALGFVRWIMDWNCSKIAIENPIGVISTRIRKPDQIIQPWQFGHGETKATCLWLKGLPLLSPTNIVAGRASRIHKMPGGKRQAEFRSLTYQGIADAMAAQWGE